MMIDRWDLDLKNDQSHWASSTFEQETTGTLRRNCLGCLIEWITMETLKTRYELKGCLRMTLDEQGMTIVRG